VCRFDRSEPAEAPGCSRTHVAIGIVERALQQPNRGDGVHVAEKERGLGAHP
jgi:hypothetical protein